LRTIRLKLSEIPKQTINLGYCGENNNTLVLFDCTDEIVPGEEYFVYMSIERPTGEKEGVVLTLSDGLAEWIITSTDLTAQFYGEYQITLKHGEDTSKTAIGHYVVNRSVVVNPEPEPPKTGLTGRTFRLNKISDELFVVMRATSIDPPSFETLFVTNFEEHYIGYGMIMQQKRQGNPELDYSNVSYSITAYRRGAFTNDSLRTIRFVAEPVSEYIPPLGIQSATTEETLAWLAENAEEITDEVMNETEVNK
jgi:hypothetical protein